ncbi:ARM repeat-containing protein [Dentipellis sp. KUC8613]|nr:ARM repeat-containing protein [Dentipellis sp. KUC8613]
MGKKAADPPLQHVSVQELYSVVCGAASQNPSEMLPASARLKEMLDLPGAYDALHDIAAQRSLPLAVRQLSMIQFKNAAVNHWRTRRLFSPEDKARIRARCLAFLEEEDDTISRCNEVIVARLGRQDFPTTWPSLVSDLMTRINGILEMRSASTTTDPHSSLILQRALRVLNSFLKEFSKMKMMTGVNTMRELHLPLSNHHATAISAATSSLSSSDITPRAFEDLAIAHLLFKAVMKLALWVWVKTRQQPYTQFEPWFLQFFQSTALQLRSLSEFRINLAMSLQTSGTVPDPTTARSLDMLTRYIRTIGKFFRRLQQIDVQRFVALPTCDDIVSYYWDKVVQANASQSLIADSPVAVFPVRFLVQGMVIFKESLAQWSPSRKRGPGNGITLPKEFVERAVTLLVTNFMPLNPSDLEGWMADPEEWVHVEEKEDEQWEFEIRPCAERVLMTFSNQYAQYVSPLLAEAFQKMNSAPISDMQGVINKEAIYCAVGRCAHRLKDLIDFSGWLEIALVEVRSNDTNYLILKRRIAWLIGKWVSDMCSTPNDTRIWQILLQLLSERGAGTEVVRLTAATAIRECVDTIDFNADIFVQFMEPTVTELLRLIGDAESLESKRKVAGCLITIIDRAEARIIPLVGTIMEPLPQLWASAGDEWLFKGTLLSTVSGLISASLSSSSVREHSDPLAVIVVPLVRESLDPRARVHIDEDALNLWSIALRNATSLNSLNGVSLADLFPLAISLLSENLDLLGNIMGIVESYFLMDATRIAQNFATTLFPAALQAMGQALPTNVKDILIGLELLFQLAPPSAYAEALHVTGLFASLIKTIVEDKADTTILTHHIYIMARMAVADKTIFLQLMSATSNSQGVPETQLWEGLLDQWWRRFDNMYEPRHRKLAAMGIASLLSTGRQEVLQRLPTEIFNLWLDVFAELKEVLEKKDESDDATLRLYWDQPQESFWNDTQGTVEYDRRKSIYDNDIIRTTALAPFIAHNLQQAEISCGGTQVMQNQYLAKADPDVTKQVMAAVFGK